MQSPVVHVLAGGAVPERGEEIADRALDRSAAGLALVAANAFEPLDQGGDFLGLFGKMVLALRGDLERLARALAFRFLVTLRALREIHGGRRIDQA